MNAASWALSEDLGPIGVAVVLGVAATAMVLLVGELRGRDRRRVWILLTGLLATLASVAAVLRPVSVETRGSVVGPRVLVLVDGSRRLLLPAGAAETRRSVARRVVDDLRRRFDSARLTVLEFGDDRLSPFAEGDAAATAGVTAIDSDLVGALRQQSTLSVERPQAIVVVSDGRLTRPSDPLEGPALRDALGTGAVPVHTVAVTETTPADASVLRVNAAGTVVAHQPFELRIAVACVGGLRCGAIPVRVRELRLGGDPLELASGRAELVGDSAEVALTVALDRAGPRVLEVAIDAPPGDTIPDNDRRIVALDVARDRIRILHVAGRPGYDARALRSWLKADESVDLVAFFILRSPETDDVQADESELALIEFPVDELFTQHLPSFDAVILQDIDAVTNKLARHLPALARYVEAGGGLIMVGGPSGFAGGQYAGTDVERVLPVTLPEAKQYFDASDFVPRYSSAGRDAPILRGLRELLGDELPSMPGANLVGPARPGAIVLWEHPLLRAGGGPMPVLAVGEAGDGRTIALAVDGTHRLAFGPLAAQVGGRSYGAAWDGLLGWLMRDPRYEPARIRLVGTCFSDASPVLEVVPAPGTQGDVEVSVERLGGAPGEPRTVRVSNPSTRTVTVRFPPLGPGGYVARARIGRAPPMRFDFACERGGPAWADVRPDAERLRRIAQATGGLAEAADRVGRLPTPPNVRVAAERHVAPWLPAWAWSLCATGLLALHWLLRRRGGLP